MSNKKSTNKKLTRVFFTVDLADDIDSALKYGFQIAKDYPKHNILNVTYNDENQLFLVFNGKQPSSSEILKMLQDQIDSDPDNDMFVDFLNSYKEEINDEINYEMDEILEQ